MRHFQKEVEKKNLLIFNPISFIDTHTHMCTHSTQVTQPKYPGQFMSALLSQETASGGQSAFATVFGARDARAHKIVPDKEAGYRWNSVS